MPQNINRVVLTGNLTRDPELNEYGGTQICKMRLACNGRIKRDDGWQDKANYFDVVAFGAQAENCQRYLAKGRAIAVDGRLDWREWEKDGQKRQAVQVIADNVQFLSDGGGERSESSGGSSSDFNPPPVSAPAADDDIPF